ncbi:M56 family metallopeptidase [Pedobacter mucosus]|uniref:M56 family metallopeptidase n=1 Tax=Pedobacter mucosus TaxID=2895286 RepID=UPI001EE40914|nr:M56 family metallopeptidase [Pedobacter mucosus]UKT63192.1 TonB family protein [Pedobacter mucosus]
MTFAHYLLQVNLYLIIFYGFYKLLLDKETYFTLNRGYLVAAGALSLGIPFIRLEWLTEQKAAQHVYTTVSWDTVLQQATSVTENSSGNNLGTWVVYIYCGGALFFLGKLIFNLFMVKRLLKTTNTGTAFSFLSKKVIDYSLPQMEIINVHEDAHIKQLHTLDILFFEIVGIITWLNPVIYFYKKAIKNIHEYLADEDAAKFQGNKADYALLILSQSFGISPSTLTNGFFDKSLIKKRIYMLNRERSRKRAVLKYGVFIPLFAIFIILSSATVRKNKNLITFSEELPLNKPLDLVTEIVLKPVDSVTVLKSKSLIKVKAEGVWKDFYQFLGRSIKYPEEAFGQDLQGSTQIKFIIKNGKINNLINHVSLGSGCDEEVMKAILSYKNFKKSEDGNYAIKVVFQLSGSNSISKNKGIAAVNGYKNLSPIVIIGYKSQNVITSSEGKKIFDFVSVEKQPEFPGGIREFYEYLGKSIKYPEAAKENNVQGKVFASFVVEEDGTLTDVQITRGLGSGADEEAIRVLKESPKWNPGLIAGKAVRVKYNINVNFSLNDKPIDKKATVIIKSSGLDQVNVSIGKVGATNFGDNFKGVIVLDGVRLADNTLMNTINPNNIESISVLKDQSAISVYGLKAKSGAIIITTKMDKTGFRSLTPNELIIDKKINNSIKVREKF